MSESFIVGAVTGAALTALGLDHPADQAPGPGDTDGGCPVMYQTTIQLDNHIRDARAIHRAIAHDTHPERALWAQPAPRTLIVRTARDHTWRGFPYGTVTSSSLARTRYPAGQPVTWALVANPTRCASIGPIGNRPRGHRTGISDPVQARDWVTTRLCPALDITAATSERILPMRGADGLTLTRWAYAGTGTVTDPETLARLLTDGVGRGKAFGCGMLLIGEAR